jgi:hypothetical protein
MLQYVPQIHKYDSGLFINALTVKVFSFHNQFWFLAAYLVGLNLSIRSNQPSAFKITFENSSYTQHDKRYFPKSSNSRE